MNFPDYYDFSPGDTVKLNDELYKIIKKGSDWKSHYIQITNGKQTLTLRSFYNLTLFKAYHKGQRRLNDF